MKSWHNHNLGELALIQQRGPKSFIEGHAHHIFSGVRMHLVSLHPVKFSKRKLTFIGHSWVHEQKEKLP